MPCFCKAQPWLTVKWPRNVLRQPNKHRAGEDGGSPAPDSRKIPRVEKLLEKKDAGRGCLALMPEAHASPKTHEYTHREQVQMRNAATEPQSSHCAHPALQKSRCRSTLQIALTAQLIASCISRCTATPSAQRVEQPAASVVRSPACCPACCPARWAAPRMLDDSGCEMGGQKPPKRNPSVQSL